MRLSFSRSRRNQWECFDQSRISCLKGGRGEGHRACLAEAPAFPSLALALAAPEHLTVGGQHPTHHYFQVSPFSSRPRAKSQFFAGVRTQSCPPSSRDRQQTARAISAKPLVFCFPTTVVLRSHRRRCLRPCAGTKIRGSFSIAKTSVSCTTSLQGRSQSASRLQCWGGCVHGGTQGTISRPTGLLRPKFPRFILGGGLSKQRIILKRS